MSFRFFRPWEDDWMPNTHQTRAPSHGTSAEAATMKTPHVQSVPAAFADDSRSSLEKASKVSQIVSDAHETSFEVKTQTATNTAMKDQNPKQSSDKTLSSTDSQSVKDLTAPLAAMLSPTYTDNADSQNLATPADSQEAWQNDHAGHATSANKSLFPTAISTASGASSSPSNAITARDKNDLLKDAQGNSSGGSKKLSALTRPKNLRHSVMLMQSKETENGARCNTSKRHKQIFISDIVSKQEQRHTSGKLFKCSTCEKAFPKLWNLHMHERTHLVSKPFKCTFCGKGFTNSDSLHKHQQTHEGSKPLKCTACEKAFTRSSDLHRHERIHTGSKPFKCKFCEIAFSQSGNLHAHERTHTGSKPFTCKFCEKAFACSSTLHTHERTHAGSKPFTCQFCEKVFRQCSHLRGHERTHTGIKPFKCTYCDKAFSDWSNMHRHKRNHASSKLS